MSTQTYAPFVVLRAVDTVRGETANAGIVLFAPGKALVGLIADTAKLKALHADYAALDTQALAQKVEDAIEQYAPKLSVAQQVAMLPLLVQPFAPDREAGTTLLGNDPADTLNELMHWLVLPRAAKVRAKRSAVKKPTRLALELRQWLRSAKAFSSKIEDLSRNRVVANYPIDPAADLYADLALMNGQLHLMEVMDLRGMDKLTSTTRGEAAVKGITLDEGKAKGHTVAVLAASDYGVAKPAIRLMSRYAHDVYDLGTTDERDRFAAFIAHGLHRKELVSPTLPS